MACREQYARVEAAPEEVGRSTRPAEKAAAALSVAASQPSDSDLGPNVPVAVVWGDVASDVTSSVVTMFAYCEFEVLAVHDEQVYAGNDEGGVRVFEITVAHPGPNELPILVEIAFQAPNSDFASDTADGWLDLSSLPPRVLSRAEYLAFLADGSNPDLPHDEFQAVLAQFADGEDTPVVIAGAHYAHGEAQGSAETDDAGEQP